MNATTHTNGTTDETILGAATTEQQNANDTLSSKGRTRAARATKPAANHDGTAGRIVDAIVIAESDTTNALRAAVVFIANAKDAFGGHAYSLARIGQVFRKVESADKHVTCLDELLQQSDRFAALNKARIDAERSATTSKTDEARAVLRDVDKRIKAVRENLRKAFQAVAFIRSEKGGDVRIRTDGLLQMTNGKGDSYTASASAYMQEGSKYVAQHFVGKTARGNAAKDASTTGKLANVTALASLIARAEIMTANGAVLANVPEEGAYWSRLFLALVENFRLEKSDGGKVEQRALSTLILPSTLAALRDHAKQAKVEARDKPDASKPTVSVSAAKPRKTAKTGRA